MDGYTVVHEMMRSLELRKSESYMETKPNAIMIIGYQERLLCLDYPGDLANILKVKSKVMDPLNNHQNGNFQQGLHTGTNYVSISEELSPLLISLFSRILLLLWLTNRPIYPLEPPSWLGTKLKPHHYTPKSVQFPFPQSITSIIHWQWYPNR